MGPKTKETTRKNNDPKWYRANTEKTTSKNSLIMANLTNLNKSYKFEFNVMIAFISFFFHADRHVISDYLQHILIISVRSTCAHGFWARWFLFYITYAIRNNALMSFECIKSNWSSNICNVTNRAISKRSSNNIKQNTCEWVSVCNVVNIFHVDNEQIYIHIKSSSTLYRISWISKSNY